MGRLTTHVLDTARGKPAEGLTVELYAMDSAIGAARTLVTTAVTNADGRCDAPLLEGSAFREGAYELVFDAGAYLAALGTPSSFLSQIPIRFHLFEDSHFHVPLLLSPYGYSTYRGS